MTQMMFFDQYHVHVFLKTLLILKKILTQLLITQKLDRISKLIPLLFSSRISFIFSAVLANNGKVQIHKKSQLGRTIKEALDTNKKIEVKI